MSRRLLLTLQRKHAFNPTPPEAELANLHVPFDELTGQLRSEQVFAEALRRGERIALIGPTGSGKSSITEHVLGGSFVSDVAPIRVRVGLEPDEVATDPREFLLHLVRTVAKYVGRSQRPGRRQADAHARQVTGPAGRPITVGIGAGVPWLHGDLAVELGGAVDERGPSGEDVLEQVQHILSIISAWQLRPVLVLDDTDHWVSRSALPAPDELLAGFFGRIVRVVAERLPDAAAVIAVHETYLGDQHYQAAAEFLESRVTLPRVPDADGLGRIVVHRARRVSGSTFTVDDIITPGGLVRLHRNYAATTRSLRAQLQVLHGALTHACDVGADAIDVRHIEQAIAD